MRNPDKYTWFGIEKPFPWIVLAWPVLWLWSTVREAIHPQVPTPLVIEDGPPYVIGEDFHVGEMEYPLDPFSPWIYSQLLEEWNNQHPASVEIKIGDTDYE